MGVKSFIVAVNKMDQVDYSEERFKEIEREVTRYLNLIKVPHVQFVPICSLAGVNLTSPDPSLFPWWTKPGEQKEPGPTLLECIDSLTVPNRPVASPLRIPISACYSIKGIGTIATGRVVAGTVAQGTKLTLGPGLSAVVGSIELFHNDKKEAQPGDIIGFRLKETKKTDVVRGMVAARSDQPCPLVTRFTAQIQIYAPLGAIRVGYSPYMHIHTATAPVKFVKLIEKTTRRSNGEIETEQNPAVLGVGMAVVELKVERPLPIEPYAQCPPLGRFVLRDANTTVAVGVVRTIQP